MPLGFEPAYDIIAVLAITGFVYASHTWQVSFLNSKTTTGRSYSWWWGVAWNLVWIVSYLAVTLGFWLYLREYYDPDFGEHHQTLFYTASGLFIFHILSTKFAQLVLGWGGYGWRAWSAWVIFLVSDLAAIAVAVLITVEAVDAATGKSNAGVSVAAALWWAYVAVIIVLEAVYAWLAWGAKTWTLPRPDANGYGG